MKDTLLCVLPNMQGAARQRPGTGMVEQVATVCKMGASVSGYAVPTWVGAIGADEVYVRIVAASTRGAAKVENGAGGERLLRAATLHSCHDYWHQCGSRLVIVLLKAADYIN